MSGFGSDGLSEKGSSISSIEVGEETIDTGFTPSSQSLTEVDKVSDSVKVVFVLALLRWGSTTGSNDVGQEGSVAYFLDDVRSTFCGKSGDELTWLAMN